MQSATYIRILYKNIVYIYIIYVYNTYIYIIYTCSETRASSTYTKSIRIGCRYGDSFNILNSGVLNLCEPCCYKSTLTRAFYPSFYLARVWRLQINFVLSSYYLANSFTPNIRFDYWYNPPSIDVSKTTVHSSIKYCF